jgi:hypothetical protein
MMVKRHRGPSGLLCIDHSPAVPGKPYIEDLRADVVVQEQDKGPGDQSSPEDITKAKEAVAAALTAIRETS